MVAAFDGGPGAETLSGGDASVARRLAAAVRLEAAALEQAYGDVAAAEAHLKAAEAALGTEATLTGLRCSPSVSSCVHPSTHLCMLFGDSCRSWGRLQLPLCLLKGRRNAGWLNGAVCVVLL